MTIQEVIADIDLLFTSGNEIPVSRATISREQWELIKKHLIDSFTGHKKECDGCKWYDVFEVDGTKMGYGCIKGSDCSRKCTCIDKFERKQ